MYTIFLVSHREKDTLKTGKCATFTILLQGTTLLILLSFSLQIQKMKLLLLAALVAVAMAHPVEVSEDDLNEWENFKVRVWFNKKVLYCSLI